jgi:hypothetical protein
MRVRGVMTSTSCRNTSKTGDKKPTPNDSIISTTRFTYLLI